MPATDLLIPVRRCIKRRGRFRWPANAVLAGPRTQDALPLGQLADDLARLRVRARIARNAWGPATVRIRRDGFVPNPEGYRLTVSPQGVEIVSSTAAGAYYGVQTLRELVAGHGRTLPACVIDDAPAFRRRGVYLDCSRGKVPRLETLKTLVEQLARWK
ncbi:MAG TPA: glycoside hydrolase family 20 zincin-like fold domain-containing protein, partial [Phycisphaerae bacterium]|nr:glycoside hydrolase family 20 zincin-like fold domain-containing protein [Phycisphaerae bacterium]